MNIAVLVKQVPRAESLLLLPNGRVNRVGVELEMNAYCRRAVSKGVELAKSTHGRCVVYTLGPPQSEDVVREAIAWGADEGVLISDPAFAGSDTLATARVLSTALKRDGPWDLIFAGLNSIDSDTGQVGPQVAEMLCLPFLAGVRKLEVEGRAAHMHCELDDGWRECRVAFPAVLSAAERLIEPCKVPVPARRSVPPDRIRHVTAGQLGSGPWGAEGSPTSVGQVRTIDIDRKCIVLSGPIEEQVTKAVTLLDEMGSLEGVNGRKVSGQPGIEAVASGGDETGPMIVVVVEPNRSRVTRELLGEAAKLASESDGSVTAIGMGTPEEGLAVWGASRYVELVGPRTEEDAAAAIADWCALHHPWAGLVPATLWGREVASRVAVRLDAGLTGDAVGFGIENRRLISWKPAFSGHLVAAIASNSECQLATVRPGILTLRTPRSDCKPLHVEQFVGPNVGRVITLSEGRNDDIEALLAANAVVAVGAGVSPHEYGELSELVGSLHAEMAASRKVTDSGSLPRARQVGITGQSIDPAVYIAIGISGKFNHMVGVRGAGTIVAINNDSSAPIFENTDIGIVGDWHEVIPALTHCLGKREVRSRCISRQPQSASHPPVVR
jgi:electron transfer flavoprotein alpha subunit